MDKVSLWKLFTVFGKIGAFTIGGGYMMLPAIQDEISRRGWIPEEELTDMVALAQSAPGLLTVNMAIFAGYRLRGTAGSVVATLGCILAPVVFILLIAMLFRQFAEHPLVVKVFSGVRPAAVAVMDNFDMSIVYTGYVLAELRKVTAELKRPAFLLYVPDHSEEPSSRRSTTVPDRVYYEIPMFLYFNDAYRREHPEIVALARAAKDRPFQTDLVLQLIARLMDVPEELIDPAEDLLSPRYRPPVRLVGLGSAPYPGDKPRDPGP